MIKEYRFHVDLLLIHWHVTKTICYINRWVKNEGKLHFTILNYTLDYTLHHKLSDYTLCTLNYHTYHALHPDVIFAVIFNRILLHVTSTCFLLKWNKVKRLKQPSSNSIKTKPKFFPHLPLFHVVVKLVPLSAQIH